jgi:CHAD domain-containing protein
MATLQRGESGTEGARRLTRRRLGDACEVLDGSHLYEEDVHRARIRLKKARAALRLLRAALGKQRFRRENAALRQVARKLTPWRDATVLVQALEGLGVPTPEADSIRRHLRRQQADARAQLLRHPRELSQLRSTLREAHRRAGRWRVKQHGWSVLGEALRQSYKRGRRALKEAARVPTDEHLHSLRKQAKLLGYQLELLQPMGPRRLEALTRSLRALTQTLGNDHDLALLRQTGADTPDLFGTRAAREAFLRRLDRARMRLQRQAGARGRDFYHPVPDTFVERLEPLWRAWRR